MPFKINMEVERTLRSFLREASNGSKISHLAKWEVVSKGQYGNGFAIGGLKF